MARSKAFKSVLNSLPFKVASSGKQASKANATSFGVWVKSMAVEGFAKVVSGTAFRFYLSQRLLMTGVEQRLTQVHPSYRNNVTDV